MEKCRLSISRLTDLGCDFTLLFWLRFPQLINSTALGKDLAACMEKVDISTEELACPAFKTEFFQHLRQHLNTTAIHPISPQNFVCDSGKGGKERCIQKYRDARWPRPNQPFCFQTRADVNSAFFIFQCWQASPRTTDFIPVNAR